MSFTNSECKEVTGERVPARPFYRPTRLFGLFTRKKTGIVQLEYANKNYGFCRRIIEFFSADFPSTIPKEMLQKTDYTRPVYVQAHKAQMDPEIKKQGFTSRNGSSSPSGGVVKVYAPVAFASFRQALGISHRDYVESMSANYGRCNYVEFLTNSKSSAKFFSTYDQRFLIKMETRKSMKDFMGSLQSYMEHFMSYPRSLLVKVVGAYSVTSSYGPRYGKKYFVVMHSVFWPSIKAKEKFDLKGCFGGRYVDLDDAGSDCPVFKDGNFSKITLDLEANLKWFLWQVSVDVSYLSSINVFDYSLLIGIEWKNFHHPHKNYTPAGLADISSPSSGTTHNWLFDRKIFEKRMKPRRCVKSKKRCNQSVALKELQRAGQPHPQRSSSRVCRGLSGRMEGSDCFADPDGICHRYQRKSFSDISGPTTVLETSHARYYCGIIDICARYNAKKRFAGFLKTVKYLGWDHSTVEPSYYASRFIAFMEKHFQP